MHSMRDVAEMFWILLCNVSDGDWTKQSEEWQGAAAKCRDRYFELENKIRGKNPLQDQLFDLITLMPDSQTQELVDYIIELRDIRRKEYEDSRSVIRD